MSELRAVWVKPETKEKLNALKIKKIVETGNTKFRDDDLINYLIK